MQYHQDPSSSHVNPRHRTQRLSAEPRGWQLDNARYLDQNISMLQSSLLRAHLVVAKGTGHQEDWSSPPRKDPEQKFRRLGGKHSGGNYTYKRHSWWSGEQKPTCPPLLGRHSAQQSHSPLSLCVQRLPGSGFGIGMNGSTTCGESLQH